MAKVIVELEVHECIQARQVLASGPFNVVAPIITKLTEALRAAQEAEANGDARNALAAAAGRAMLAATPPSVPSS